MLLLLAANKQATGSKGCSPAYARSLSSNSWQNCTYKLEGLAVKPAFMTACVAEVVP